MSSGLCATRMRPLPKTHSGTRKCRTWVLLCPLRDIRLVTRNELYEHGFMMPVNSLLHPFADDDREPFRQGASDREQLRSSEDEQ